MIQELWDYFTTESSKEAKSDGYLYHSIALAHRARRCRRYWSEHLRHCHELLNSELPSRRPVSRLAVLGSGLLLETPPEILSHHFTNIDLIDVVHTKTVRDLIAHFDQRSSGKGSGAQFRFVEADLNREDIEGGYDFAISANLLSQLSYVLANRLRKQARPEEEVAKLTLELQTRHLQQVRTLAKNYLLFSDFSLNIRDLKGEIIDSSVTVDSSLNLQWQNPWSWNLAPAPEFSKNHSVELIVGFIRS